MNFKRAAAFLLPLALAACASGPQRPTIVQGPHQATDGGIAGGSAQADAIMASLSDADQAFMATQVNHTLESAPTNQPATWRNPDGGAQVKLTATHTFQRPDNVYCRDFIEQLTKGETAQTARGTACRRPDGTWQTTG
jgi:surface antigen